jgi:leucyl-tRNA synthetase
MEILEKHGSDALRVAMLFAAPPDREINWTGDGIPGAVRFLRRAHRLIEDHAGRLRAAPKTDPGMTGLSEGEERLYRALHRTKARAARDLDSFRHNTAIAALMEFVRDLTSWKEPESPVFLHSLREFIRCLAPVAPHLGEELWRMAGGEESVFKTGWITWDESALAEDVVTVVVQVNGKLRAQLSLPRGTPREEVEAAAHADERVQRAVGEHRVARVVVIPDRLVNLVLAK